MTQQRSPRLGGIDTLRGLSILAVVLLHIALHMRAAGHSLEGWMPQWLYRLLFWNGYNGVRVFFAVSGFLITTTSRRRFGALRDFQPWTFYRLRFARITPLLLLLLAVLSVLHLAGAEGFVIRSERASLPRAVTAAVTFHVNWLEAERGYLPASWDVLWSLSVEEVFYLFFPLFCLALPAKWITPALLAFAGMGPFARTCGARMSCGRTSPISAAWMRLRSVVCARFGRSGYRLTARACWNGRAWRCCCLSP